LPLIWLSILIGRAGALVGGAIVRIARQLEIRKRDQPRRQFQLLAKIRHYLQ
jgi:hypothetical protein